ncbi:hypothetical protein BWGOE4_22150 [Bacillus mycoides]|uniref:hypothetical protein n=1 Tax=Bacillus cereus group TaxID=86661 RepID=UPI0008723BF6|nr:MULTISPECIES: hypothetical protein [Bacillus cereus group]OFD49857.1 hypothetical protein BWGOE3_22150 [Bacillus mycoides]OFD61289.1 hypothetical protein BWGOE6_22960 [Bacillus mycoides]OFD63008.1 hypothetical protein BWGOE4_22150 [Bacillus mycoides]OFD66922.1 hypothetical protein BWGOE7_22240 [Bacillus mycoides]OFD97086.1 hypothetical protein BWGOE12_22670 [Bacillus mycoides]
MLENPMSMHNGYGKADPQEQEGIMTTSIDAEKLQDAISRAVMILQEYPEGAEPEGVNRSINEALELLQKYLGQ